MRGRKFKGRQEPSMKNLSETAAAAPAILRDTGTWKFPGSMHGGRKSCSGRGRLHGHWAPSTFLFSGTERSLRIRLAEAQAALIGQKMEAGLQIDWMKLM